MIYRAALNVDFKSQPLCLSSIELMDVVITSGNQALRTVCIYKPPPSKANKLTAKAFHDDLATILETCKKGNFLLIGDFNIHFDCPDKPEVKKTVKQLQIHGLSQHVRTSTHKSGHILDWVVTKDSDSATIIKSLDVIDRQMSDHSWIHITLNFQKPSANSKEVSYRNIKAISKDDFRRDLECTNLLLLHSQMSTTLQTYIIQP